MLSALVAPPLSLHIYIHVLLCGEATLMRHIRLKHVFLIKMSVKKRSYRIAFNWKDNMKDHVRQTHHRGSLENEGSPVLTSSFSDL